MIQLSLIQDTTIKKSIISVDIHELAISKFNPRYSRDEEDIDRLAQRISRNGFEITRALWVYKNGNGYEVFAGGNRLEAAKRAGLKKVPIVLHEGANEADIVRLADEDNENDEYHSNVPVIDQWAHYAYLIELGWSQEQVATAKGLKDTTWVSRRLSFNKLSTQIKNLLRQESITEGHLVEIYTLCVDAKFSTWTTADQAQQELIKRVTKTKPTPTTKQTREEVGKWKDFIKLAQDYHDQLSPDFQPAFVEFLAKSKARSKSEVQTAYSQVVKLMTEEARRKEEELARQQSQAEAERIRFEREQEEQRRVEEITSRLIYGDCFDGMEKLPDNSIDFIFTDPPYDEASIGLYGRLAEIASRKLKPNGSLIVYAGHYALPAIFEQMTPHLRYWWAVSLDHAGPSARLPGKWVFVEWKPMLWFVKGGRKDNRYVSDKFKSSTPNKEYHEWAQDTSEATYYIEQLTDPGDLVVDPFCGSATTVIAALAIGRQAIGYESDEERYRNGKERLYNFARQAR